MLCFRPPSRDGSFKPVVSSTDCKSEPVCFFPMDSTPLTYRDIDGLQDKKKHVGNGRFSRTIKSLLFGKRLDKKMKIYRRRKSKEKDSDETKREGGKYLISINDEIQLGSSKLKDVRKIDTETPSFASSSQNSSSSSSAITSTSLCSMCSSSLRETNNNPFTLAALRSSRIDGVDNSQNRVSGGGGGCVSSRGIWCLLAISMFGLAVWGKVCGITCTLLWSLLFVPCRNWIGSSSEGERISNKKVEREENSSNNTSFDSDKYKKKVIMEGLLARDRSHALSR